MTNNFDPAKVDQHMKHSARLRSEAFHQAIRSVGCGIKHSARALVMMVV